MQSWEKRQVKNAALKRQIIEACKGLKINNSAQAEVSRRLSIPGWWDFRGAAPEGVHVCTAPDPIDGVSVADQFGYILHILPTGEVEEVTDEVADKYRDLVPAIREYQGTRLYGHLRREGYSWALCPEERWTLDWAIKMARGEAPCWVG